MYLAVEALAGNLPLYPTGFSCERSALFCNTLPDIWNTVRQISGAESGALNYLNEIAISDFYIIQQSAEPGDRCLENVTGLQSRS